MPTVEDSLGARGQEASLLKDSLDTISKNQTLTFHAYIRVVLPLDGYAFWVKAIHVNKAAIPNILGVNTTTPNQMSNGDVDTLFTPGNAQGAGPNMIGVNTTTPNQVSIEGNSPTPVPVPIPDDFYSFVVQASVHYATDIRQEETANIAINRVEVAAQSFIQQFNYVSPNLIYIASFRGFRFAFSGKGMFYEQMKLWHYSGDAVYPNMASQIIDVPSQLDQSKIIVSNSLPLWLSLQYYAPPYPVEVPIPALPLFPSFLATQNIRPPYGVIHIGPEDTSTDQTIPAFDRRLSSSALSRDRVRVTLYGLNDDTAQDWLIATLGYLRDARTMGLCNMPNIRDDKLTQRELLVIAMKKRIDFEVSYIQSRVRDQSRTMLEKIININVLENVLTPTQSATPNSMGVNTTTPNG